MTTIQKNTQKLLCRSMVILLLFSLLFGLAAGCTSVPDDTKSAMDEELNQEGEPKRLQSVRKTAAVDLETKNPLLPSDFEPIAQTKTLELHAKLQTGEIAVVNREDQSVWFSNPQDREDDRVAKGALRHSMASQIIAIFSNTLQAGALATSAFHAFEKGEVTFEKIPGGIVFWYDFVKENFSVPVRFLLDEEYLEASVITDEIEERADCQVLSIELLPYFGACSDQHQGYLFVPDGSGALIHLNNGMIRADSYEEMVYGQNALQPREFLGPYECPVLMPVFGMQVDGSAFLAVITENEGNCSVKAKINGKDNSYNAVNSRLFFRSTSTVRLPAKNWISKDVTVAERRAAIHQNYTVRYYFLSGEKANYMGMAERYRQYLQENKKLKTELNKQEESPFYVDTYGYIRKKVPVLGIPVNRDIRLTAFNDACQMSEALSAAGIKNQIFRYSAWEEDSFLWQMPASAKIDPVVGKKSDLDALKRQVEEQGGSLYLNTDFVNITKTGHGFSKYEHAAMNMVNIAHVSMDYDLAVHDRKYDVRWYLTSPRYYQHFVSDYLPSFCELNQSCLAFEGLGSMVYSDFGIRGVSRADVPGLICDALEAAAASVPNFMFETGNIYAARYASHIVNVPTGSSHFSIENEEIPFYQAVLHGYISMAGSAINLHSDPDKAFLCCLEYGTSPMFSWISADSENLKDTRLNALYSANYRDWIAYASEKYAEFSPVLQIVSHLPMTDHRILKENVRQTSYGFRYTITINYNDHPVEIDGQIINALDYVITERGT